MLRSGDKLECEEARLLEQAAAFAEGMRLDQVTPKMMRALTQSHGIDFATAVLYCLCREAMVREPQPTSDSSIARELQLAGLQLAIVPGAFYKEHPQTGADGGRLRAAAKARGLDCQLIPVESLGLLETNAEAIVAWLNQNATRPTVLVSFSKGGADVKVALRHPQASRAFENVRGWYSVCGIVGGSPMVDWIYQRRSTWLITRLLLWVQRRNFRFASQLRTGPQGALDSPIHAPPHLDVRHVVGFPLERHLSCRRSLTWHRRLTRFGPNDGATVLLDVCQQPGSVLPVWGADHYAAANVDWSALVREIVRRDSVSTSVEPASVNPHYVNLQA